MKEVISLFSLSYLSFSFFFLNYRILGFVSVIKWEMVRKGIRKNSKVHVLSFRTHLHYSDWFFKAINVDDEILIIMENHLRTQMLLFQSRNFSKRSSQRVQIGKNIVSTRTSFVKKNTCWLTWVNFNTEDRTPRYTYTGVSLSGCTRYRAVFVIGPKWNIDLYFSNV